MTDNIDYSKILAPFYREIEPKPAKTLQLSLYDNAHSGKEQKERYEIGKEYMLTHYNLDIKDCEIKSEHHEGLNFFYVDIPNPEYKIN